jgi:hypothetical protein
MIIDDSCTTYESSYGQEEWASSHSRIRAAYEGLNQEELLAYFLPVEIGFIINRHFFLLRDLWTFGPKWCGRC